MKYSIIDLFAGAGGLSLGFMQTGKFEVKAAVENNKFAQETYIKNHPGVLMLGDVCSVDYKKIINELGSFDIVIGGPPCQGFSNANRQKNHIISQNNRLVKEYVRAVQELNPKAFILENVSMLKSDVHRFYVSEGEIELLQNYSIKTRTDDIQLLPGGILDIEKSRTLTRQESFDKFLWDEKTYNIFNSLYKKHKKIEKMKLFLISHRKDIIRASNLLTEINSEDDINRYNYNLYREINDFYLYENNMEGILFYLEKCIFLQRMYGKMKELQEFGIYKEEFKFDRGINLFTQSYSVIDYLNKVLTNETYGYEVESDVLNAADFGAPQKRKRFIMIGVKKDYLNGKKLCLPQGLFKNNYRTVRDAIYDLVSIEPSTDIAKQEIYLENLYPAEDSLLNKLRDSKKLSNHVTTKTRTTALNRFSKLKQGENFHDLEDSLKEDTYSDVKRTQNTIYLRLKYDEPSGTVVNVRKSMWIHPEHNRAISIREAARLQTFPDSFVFTGTKDSQYQQVGNAVPPILAEAIAEKVSDLLE